MRRLRPLNHEKAPLGETSRDLHHERTEKGDRETEYPEDEEEPPAGTNEGSDNTANYGQAKDNLLCPDPEQRAQR